MSLLLGGTLAIDTQMQAICRSMHVQGMLIDQQERARLQAKYAARSRDYAAKCRTLALNPGLNLNSPPQVGDQLYASRLSGGFGCEVIAYTDSGAPSTADPAIRPLLRDPTLPSDARDFILAYRQYKKSDKILGTFLRPAEPVPEGGARQAACLEAVAEARGLLEQARCLLPAGASADRGAFLRKAEDALDAAVDRAGRLLDGRLWTTDLWELGADEPGAAWGGDTDEDGVPRALPDAPAPGGGVLVRAVYSSEDRAALRRALHEVWHLTPRRTLKGGITVARGALVELWRDPASADSGGGAREFLGTILQAFAACSEARRLALPPADAEEDRCYLRRQTGRVHADWRAVVTGRLASSPNLQNCPRAVRSMFVPGPGRRYAYADKDQLELRVLAARWSAATGIESRYLEAFARGLDPHQITMHLIFGDVIWDWPGAPPVPELHFYKSGKQAAQAGVRGAEKWKGIDGYFDTQRDLCKRVCYACLRRGTAVWLHSAPPADIVAGMSLEHAAAMYSLAGAPKPIEDVQAGDWTWAWSRERQRYEPARITRAWCTGRRRCVRVTFKQRKGFGHAAVVAFEIATYDHLFLLRDGTYRRAEDLRLGDRLMPFRRMSTGGGYTDVDPTNTGRRVREHRHVVAVRDGHPYPSRVHAHHKNRNRTDNRPENLEALLDGIHYAEHADAIVAGRLASRRWREAISGPAASERSRRRSRAYWASLEGQAERERRMGPQESVLDPFAHRIGTVPDRVIAEEAGVTPEAVAHWRKQHSVEAWETCEHREHGTPTERVQAVQHRLGVDSDTAIAKDLGCDRKVVWLVREALGIAPASRAGTRTGPQVSALDPFIGLFGRVPSGEIAALAGVKAAAASAFAAKCKVPGRVDKAAAHEFAVDIGRVSDEELATRWGGAAEGFVTYREAHGIPPYWEMDGEPHNHSVVSVEPAGEHEVWDIEVDHEDHNFALASGIFVHNSAYGAEAPTVHDVITSAEDDEGNLPYQDLTVREVAAMRHAWLEHAPEVEAGWAWEMQEVERLGYFQCPMSGRKLWYRDGLEPNKVYNGPIQLIGRVFVIRAALALAERYPGGFAGPGTGQVNDCHDALTFEVPTELAPEVRDDMQVTMTQRDPSLPGVDFPAEAKIKTRWEAARP